MDFCGFNRWLRPAFSRVSTKNLPLIVFPRLDFQTFSGFEVDTVTTGIGVCTDSFQAAGQTGVNPPAICGTNTGYHSNWVRLSGPVSVCSVSVRGVWGCCWRHDHTDQHAGHWHLQLEHPRQADLLYCCMEVREAFRKSKTSMSLVAKYWFYKAFMHALRTFRYSEAFRKG